MSQSTLPPTGTIPDATTSVKGKVQLATPSSDTTAGHVVQASDARMSDARTPTHHASIHHSDGPDPLFATDIGALDQASNLGDLEDASSARDNLGLGNSATLNLGTTNATVAEGNHVHLGTTAAAKTVRAATVAPLPSNTYGNGSLGTGATLTGTSNGTLAAQDEVTLIAGDRLLVKDEATGSHNGLYSVTQVGDASHPYILTRGVDADSSTELGSGVIVLVQEGATNGDSSFELTTNAPITVGTTSLSFSAFSTTAILPVTRGGTGSGTAGGARTNLGLGTAATKDIPASGDASTTQVVYGTDSRLTNSRAPTDHDHTGTGDGGDLTGALISNYIDVTEQSSNPSAPGSGKARLTIDTNHVLKWIDNSGKVYDTGHAIQSNGGSALSSRRYLNIVTGLGVTAPADDSANDATKLYIPGGLVQAYNTSRGTANKGDVFLSTDGIYAEIYDGSAWKVGGPVLALTKPPTISGNLTWDNQGSATGVDTKGGVQITSPNSTGIRALYKTPAYSTPYQLIIGFVRNGQINSSGWAGAIFRDSGGKIMTCAISQNGSFLVDKYNSSTSFNANAKSDGLGLGWMQGVFFLRIRDNGTNILFDYSTDFMLSWVNRYSEARGTFFSTAPNAVGIAVDDKGQGLAETMWCFHFQEVNA